MALGGGALESDWVVRGSPPEGHWRPPLLGSLQQEDNEQMAIGKPEVGSHWKLDPGLVSLQNWEVNAV